MTTDKSSIEVGTITLTDLFTNKLNIPDFQRPYEWNERLVFKLFRDIEAHFYKNESFHQGNSFYLGSILLFEENDVFHVVDGQQRLTTFLILDYILRRDKSLLKNGSSFTFYNSSSIKNIKTIRDYITKNINELKFTKSNYQKIIDEITLNVVIASDEDRAAQFFDSLNSKGKKLETINILKSYHLRALEGEKELQLQLSSNFDLINAKIESQSFKKNHIYSLNQFVTILWVRIFNWTKGNFNDIDKSDLEEYFQDNAISYSTLGKRHLKLYPGIRNMRSHEAIVQDKTIIYRSEYTSELDGSMYCEFNPLLPIQKGLGFFLSMNTLETYFNNLFVIPNLELLLKINKLAKESFNDYFLHLYYMSILSYYIKFGQEKIEDFAIEIEQILGNKLITLQSVKENSPIVILRDEFNLLQAIYLNIDVNMLLAEMRKYKASIKVRKLSISTNDGKNQIDVSSSKGNVSYPIHTSRPQYIKRALATYGFDDEDLAKYIQLSKNLINYERVN